MVATTFEDPEVSDAVIAAIMAGRKIEAIKLVRSEHGLGLKEAKELVERIPIPFSASEQVRRPPRAEGGAIRMLIVLGILGAGLMFYFSF